jgi:prepilin-type N-terminal cleavage/methylation domain-containing protein
VHNGVDPAFSTKLNPLKSLQNLRNKRIKAKLAPLLLYLLLLCIVHKPSGESKPMQTKQSIVRQNGFTLIELGIVIGIMAVVLSFVVSQIGAVRDAYLRGAVLDSLTKWADIARQTGLELAEYERCEVGEPCVFNKSVLASDCPSSAAQGNTSTGGGLGGLSGPSVSKHYYAEDGSCIYNLHEQAHREILGLDHDIDYSNTQNGAPIYLVHREKTVEALTCVDSAFVEGLDYLDAWRRSDEDICLDLSGPHHVLAYTIPALKERSAKALARRAAFEPAEES